VSQQSCARCDHPSTCACRPSLTPAQAVARLSFNLEEAMARLPPSPASSARRTTRGAAGVRLCGHQRATVSEDLLRDFACNELGAVRIRQPSLEALRVILGNQAEAERRGHTLEMNIRTDFATERVMRNIIDQMKAAGITTGQRAYLGGCKAQEVQCYVLPMDGQPAMPALDLIAVLRAEEGQAEAGRCKASWPDGPSTIQAEEVPF
jgi:hypothetical protein